VLGHLLLKAFFGAGFKLGARLGILSIFAASDRDKRLILQS
jgi:hypothetical protein